MSSVYHCTSCCPFTVYCWPLYCLIFFDEWLDIFKLLLDYMLYVYLRRSVAYPTLVRTLYKQLSQWCIQVVDSIITSWSHTKMKNCKWYVRVHSPLQNTVHKAKYLSNTNPTKNRGKQILLQLLVFNAILVLRYASCFMTVGITCWGKRCIQRKPPTWRKSLTKFIR
jgi:hypothetical protein